ncbi:hypothetical protein [Paucibacter soli]|uniref:hypothetical protein n=1 Tax=Paucibacter soli TaxID=3133433 RepID=UPI0030B48AF4
MPKKTAQQLYDEAFPSSRPPRSEAYKQGVMACLRARINGSLQPDCPYSLGTAEADAWYSGRNEGHALARAEAEAHEKPATMAHYVTKDGITPA